MNPFEMVAIIVVAVMVASVLRAKYGHSRRQADVDPREQAEAIRLREEVKALKERIHVLERIATDRENSLAREIDDLRDR
jgi:Tfp pilus assembly protein PilN